MSHSADYYFEAGNRLGAYVILCPIGAGGMGQVYKAHDTRLLRTVTLKLLREGQDVARFQREMHALSALNHPNIVTVFDFGEVEGQNFLVTEFVQGETVRQKLSSGPLSLREALEIAPQVASALNASHELGIIHRDIKPENIMVRPDGYVKVLDFGLQKAILPVVKSQDSSTQTLSFRTEAGAILGTPSYMSPEQATGEALDTRSDIFSFGAVLYEIITGQKAFGNAAAVLRDEPRALSDLLPGAPLELQILVTRCLGKDPFCRFQTALEVKVALEKVRTQLLAVTGLPTISFGETAPSIAVLPFTNLSADKENEYFGDGLAEEVLNALARLPGLRVAARTSAFQFRGPAHDLASIGDRLNVRTILGGSVRRTADRVRVTVQLVNLADGYQIWSERYDRQMADIFDLQDDIAQAIVEQLKVKLTGHVKQSLVKRPTQSLPAYHAYLEGRYYLLKLTPESLEKSKKSFEQAIVEDPQFASPYVGLAYYYFALALFSLAVPKMAIAEAKKMVQQALQLDRKSDEAHSILGSLLSVGDHQWDEAEREFQRALALNPASSNTHNGYALWLLMPLGRFEEALAQNRLALEFDPLSPLYRFTRAWVLYNSREYDRAVEECRKVLEIDPNYHLVHRILAQVHWQRGRFDEVIASFHQAAAPFPMRPSAILGALGISYAAAGRRDEARRVLSELKELTARGYVRASVFGEIYLVLGDNVDAWGCFEKAVEDQDPAMITVGIDPFFDPFRNDSRYAELLRRMRLRI